MRYLEVRRHSICVAPSEHLSQMGISLARQVGEAMGPFQLVISSTLPRAIETAIAMGFAVDERIPQLNATSLALNAEVPWESAFAALALAMARGDATARFGMGQAGLWRSFAMRMRDGQRALIIGHGGVIEAGAVVCLPMADHAAWGAALGYCEGVCLAFDGDMFVSGEVLRVAEASQRAG
mgnify:CR=1 FL=1